MKLKQLKETIREIVKEEKEKLSKKQKEYRLFFKNTLKNMFDVDSPADLSKEDKKEFFNYIEKNWKKEKED